MIQLAMANQMKEDHEVSDDQIVRYCAPTLAGIKTGSLFTLRNASEDFMSDISAFNRTMREKGVRIIPLRACGNHMLIYLYRPEMLERDLKDPKAVNILKRFGYPVSSSDRCVVKLANRLSTSPVFPHEIGLFLGYPPTDVSGFINNPNEGYCAVGYWKVYSDVEGAKRIFKRYKQCTEEYGRMLRSGRTLEQIVV